MLMILTAGYMWPIYIALLLDWQWLAASQNSVPCLPATFMLAVPPRSIVLPVLKQSMTCHVMPKLSVQQ